MKTILGARASSILYDLLKSHAGRRPFLLPANVCPIVPLTFFKAGVPIEFVDISPDAFGMDLDDARSRLQGREHGYGGLLYVHTYGDPFTPNEVLTEIKREHPDLLLIDDRCLCVPDLEPDPLNGADAVLYSTGYAKIVDQGIGGFAFLRDGVEYRHESLPYERQALHKLESDYKHSIELHQPYRYLDVDWLQSEAELPAWPEYMERLRNGVNVSLERRRCINALYDALIPADIRLPASCQLWRYNLRVKDNRRTLMAIFDAGLFASAHYASLAGLFGPGSGPRASELASQVVNLFNDRHYTPEMAEKTARIVLGSL